MTEPTGPRNPLKRLRDLIRRRRRTPYKSPQEIALENAAESLGATIGEYYPDDHELDGLVAGVGADDPRAAAAREELLAYVASLRARRARARLGRRVRIGTALGVAAALGGGLVLFTGPPSRDASPGPAHGPPSGEARAAGLPPPQNTPEWMGTRVSVALQVGAARFVSRTFRNASGNICSDPVWVHNGIATQNSGTGCPTPDDLAETFRRTAGTVIWYQQMPRNNLYFMGYARPDVVAVAGRSGWGEVTVEVSNAWAPGNDPRFRLKAFVGRAHNDGRTPPPPGDPRRTVLDMYELRAQLDDGRVMDIRTGRHGEDVPRAFLDPLPKANARD